MQRAGFFRQAPAPCLRLTSRVQVACLCFLAFTVSASIMLAKRGELRPPALVSSGRSTSEWFVNDEDSNGGREGEDAATRPSFRSTLHAFRKWDAEVGCAAFKHRLPPINSSAFLQDSNPVMCSDLKQKHVSVLVKDHTWIPDSLNNLYACSCGLSCLWGNSVVLPDDPDALFYESHIPPGQRRVGQPLRVYIDLEPRKLSFTQDIFVSFHHEDTLQVTYAGASFHTNRNYYISTHKNNNVLVYWSSSRCMKERDDIARSFLALLPHHSFGKCLNNMGGGRDALDKMYPKCRSKDGGTGWSSNLHCGMSHYKFVLAIENTFRESYVTEKLFYALDAGSVPIYFGAPNVLELVPPKSIIVGSDFGSVEELASYVKNLAENPVQYAEYQAWRRCGELGNYVHTRAVSLDSLPCRLCATVSSMGGKKAPAS